MNNFSQKEIKMFHALSYKHLLEAFDNQNDPNAMYKIAVLDCFVLDTKGNAVESLRRTASAFLMNGNPFRMTQEFDDLIQL